MNQIEQQLWDQGWVISSEKALILDMSLLNLIDARIVDDEGKEHSFRSATLYHKGDRYVFTWSRWDQSFEEGRISLEDRRGQHTDGATHFDPYVEAVSAGFSHVLTVNVNKSTFSLWRKAK